MENSVHIFFGISGSGKGTQAELLKKYLVETGGHEVLYVETGKLFRAFMEGGSHAAGQVRQVLSEGKLLPAFLPVWIWTEYLVKNFTGKEDLIFDGVSRREEEAPILDSALQFYGFKKLFVIFLDVSHEEARGRMLKRGRYDDTHEKIEERFAWYERDVLSAIKYFKKNPNYIFLDINGEGTVSKIHKDIVEQVGPHLR